jgi:hypothetical protein
VIRAGHRAYDGGFYNRHLRRYFDRFPRNDIKVILFDDLVTRPGDIVRELFEFLGVDPTFVPDTGTAHNPSRMARSPALNRFLVRTIAALKPLVPRGLRDRGLGTRARSFQFRKAPAIPADLRKRLLDDYREDILAAGELIGRDLHFWLDRV